MELEFKVDTKERKQWFTAESFAHPAKMSLPLELWLIEKYTKPGDVILDPMAGIGTILVGATLGRNIICVELEDKFCKIMEANLGKIMQKGPQMGCKMGRVGIIQGDARNLEGLLVDKIITSPHYGIPATSQESSKNEIESRIARGIKGAVVKNGEYHTGDGKREQRYSDDPTNIANLPYGQIDKIVTSPPYAEAQSGGGIAKKGYQGSKHSPTDLVGKRSYMPENIGDDNNISNLTYGNIDAVITSPPYEEAMGEKHHSPAHNRISKDKHWDATYVERGSSPSNIGNLKSQSYLEAMLQVYQQCHKVLKPNGLLILVTKNFIRNKQVIRLDLDTIKLCEQAGFKLTEQHKRKLPAQSFWRIIYYQKHPEVEKIDHEDILVFQKRNDNEVV